MFSVDPTLLVVEQPSSDTHLIRIAARMALPGLDVRVAGDAREGMAYLAGTPPFQDRSAHPFPDLVIFDAALLDEEGPALLACMRDARGRRPLAVVALDATGNDRPGSDLAPRSPIVDACYRKPSSAMALRTLVAEIVGRWLFPAAAQMRNGSGSRAPHAGAFSASRLDRYAPYSWKASVGSPGMSRSAFS